MNTRQQFRPPSFVPWTVARCGWHDDSFYLYFQHMKTLIDSQFARRQNIQGGTSSLNVFIRWALLDTKHVHLCLFSVAIALSIHHNTPLLLHLRIFCFSLSGCARVLKLQVLMRSILKNAPYVISQCPFMCQTMKKAIFFSCTMVIQNRGQQPLVVLCRSIVTKWCLPKFSIFFRLHILTSNV